MVDATLIWPAGFRFLDASGDVVAGGSVEVYLAGTTTPKTVHSDRTLETALGTTVHLDAGGYPVSTEGGSTKVSVYTGTEAYKIIVKNSAGTVLATLDNLLGAFDSASITDSLSVIPETEVETLTIDTPLDADDRGTLKNVNTTGGDVVITLPSAATLSNGYRFGVRMAGTANQCKIKTTGSETIARAGVSSTAVALTALGETIWLIADGGNYVVDTYVPPLMNTVGVIAIADRLATPPGSPADGARYIVTSGPTGDWSSYAQHDIAEANGQGGWFRYTPAEDCGWIAYVADENAYYFFIGTAWSLMAASDTAPGLIEIATQAEMETGTDTTRAVAPGRQAYHPAHPKAWGIVTYSGGVPTLAASYNISGITDTGTGRLTVTIDVDFSSANYAVIATTESDSTTLIRPASVSNGTRAAGSFELAVRDLGSSLTDPAAIMFACFGDQA